MTIAEWCLLGAVMLYLLTIAQAKATGRRAFDNAKPRDPSFYNEPARARALGAHQNGIETFPFFAAAVILAEFHGADQKLIDALAVTFLVLRAAYVGAYLTNHATLRSLVWGAAFVANLAIFVLPALAG